jgi:dTMP kinase
VSPRGTFVAFDGGDGAGKSTQVAMLAARAKDAGLEVVTCREPGGTPLGEAIREALLHGGATSARAELLAFNAARAALVESVIRPALERDALVVCDRFSASTVAYQQYGRGLPAEIVAGVIEAATDGLSPDLNVLLDLPVVEARTRMADVADRFETEDDGFHERVRSGFLALAAAAPERWLVLDATRSQDEIAVAVREAVETLTPRT